MGNTLLRLLITSIAVLLVAKLMPGIEVSSGWALIFTAILLGVFNAILRPIMIILTLPATLLTFGLFIFPCLASYLSSTACRINICTDGLSNIHHRRC